MPTYLVPTYLVPTYLVPTYLVPTYLVPAAGWFSITRAGSPDDPQSIG